MDKDDKLYPYRQSDGFMQPGVLQVFYDWAKNKTMNQGRYEYE